jgi:precorrin-2/cobalt-factor-2 C20-methyltransferase
MPGTLYGIGVGPGDPGLMTVKGASILGRCRHIFVPKADFAAESLVLSIAKEYMAGDHSVRELVFPMTNEVAELKQSWSDSAHEIIALLSKGEDACFLTLGDPMFYSTYIYLLRELRSSLPELEIVTVPGVTAFSAAAALTEFAVGKAKEQVTVIPTADDLENVRQALQSEGTVVLMKIGARLPEVLRVIEESGAMERSIFVAHAGMSTQRVETDLRALKEAGGKAGYMSIILVSGKEQS